MIHCECCYGDTALISGAGDAAMIQGRIRQILQQAKATAGSYDKEKLQERAAEPSGGVALIMVGAATGMGILDPNQVDAQSAAECSFDSQPYSHHGRGNRRTAEE